MLGGLFASGHGPEVLEIYSWDQIALMGECIALHHVGMLDSLIAPIAATMGIDYKPGSVKREKAGGRSTTIDYTDLDAVKRARDRDARILIGAGGIQGVKVEL